MVRGFSGFLIVLACVVFGASCSQDVAGGNALAVYRAYDLPVDSPDDPDNVRVKVSLGRQRVYVTEGGRILLAMPVSVGAESTPTPRGDFTIYRKDERHRSAEHGYAYKDGRYKRCDVGNRPAGWSFKGTPLPFWCEFKPGYAFHTGWVKHHPCTNGSIRMHENLAPKFFRMVKVGTPVNISDFQPEDAVVERLPLPPDAGPLPDYPGSVYVGDGYFSIHTESPEG